MFIMYITIIIPPARIGSESLVHEAVKADWPIEGEATRARGPPVIVLVKSY